MQPFRKVVVPVAGWGTRSLPATKNIPKEMLPIYNKPVIQYVVEEAQRAHIKDVIFVTNRDKNVIEDHFDHNLQLEDLLERSGKLDKLEEVRRVAEMVNILSVRQKRQLGLGHAVLCARELVGGEPFAVMVGDDLMFSGVPGIGQLYLNAINGRDYNLFMIDTVFYTAVGLLAGIVVDISYGFIDPRIRMGSKK